MVNIHSMCSVQFYIHTKGDRHFEHKHSLTHTHTHTHTHKHNIKHAIINTQTIMVIMETFYLCFVVKSHIRLEMVTSGSHRTGTKNS